MYWMFVDVAVLVFKFSPVNDSHNSLTFSLVYARAGNQGHSFSAPVAYLVDFLEKHLDISHCANIEDFFNNFLGNKLLYQPGP